mmetsp:Transcript_83/g.170  ORF Transcript_83/g.170 Transcript_83/m.170 type:complete len:216 (+) Transcript_83:527-1174(+)
MRIEASDSSGHGRTNKVLVDVSFNHRLHRCFQSLIDNFFWNNTFSNDALPASLQPIRGCCLFVGAHVARQGNQLKLWEFGPKQINDCQGSFAHHVHPHGITRKANKTQVYIPSCHSGRARLELSERSCGLKCSLHGGKVRGFVAPKFEASCFHRRWHSNARSSSNAVSNHHCIRTGDADSFASAVSTGYQTSFGCGHWNIDCHVVNTKRSNHSDW